MQILINNVDAVRDFVNTVAGFREKVVLVQNDKEIDGKSILAILNNGIEEPFEAYIETDDETVKEEFYDFISEWEFK